MKATPTSVSRSVSQPLTRREFAQAALASSALFAAPALLRGQNLNSKLNLAIIGAGGRGGSNLADYSKHVLLPEKDFAGFQRTPQVYAKAASHHAEWLAACKGGPAALANFDYAGWLTEANHLGNVAYRVGKKLEWDAAMMRAKNAPEADKYLKRTYRKGWDWPT